MNGLFHQPGRVGGCDVKLFTVEIVHPDRRRFYDRAG